MKFPLKWVLELCPLDSPVDKIAELLTFSGSEVENIEDLSARIDKIVVCEVEEVVENYPIQGMFRAIVEFGKGRKAIVLSRAPNIEAGSRYPFAPIGARIFGGKTITPIEFENVVSEGMLCSGFEIGLGEPKDRLLKLTEKPPIGADVKKLLGWDDVAFEIEVTPNRPDCLGILGLARELSAISGIPIEDERHMPIQSGEDAIESISIELLDPVGCPRYTARIIEGVKIGSSTLRVMGRLSASGIRPINNVVDATNYIMLLFSQPLHAFDLDRLSTDRIVVRSAKEKEKFVTLDGVERELKSGYVMIATAERAVAIAGIMGGLDSEITESTSRVLLESANFNPRRIRRASRQLGLSTESSIRFERGTDPNITARASDECSAMISYLAGGKVRRGIVDAYPAPIEPLTIKFDDRSVRDILGIDIEKEDYERYLSSLGLVKISQKEWSVPTYRMDITREVDLVEEIGRLHRYDKIEPALSGAGPIPARLSSETIISRKLSAILCGLGFDEVVCDSLGKTALFEPFAKRKISSIENPISLDFEALRPSILPSLLAVAGYNLAHEAESVKIYEFDKIFWLDGDEHKETFSFGMLACGQAERINWDSSEKVIDFYDFKGFVESLLKALRLNCSFVVCDDTPFSRDVSLRINNAENTQIGVMGMIDPKIASRFDVDIPVFCLEIGIEGLLPSIRTIPQFSQIPRYPSMRRDVALIVDSSVPAGELLSFAQDVSEGLIENIFIFDLYEGAPIPQGKKSVGISVVYRDPNKTLTDEEANEIHSRIVGEILEKFSAKIRGAE